MSENKVDIFDFLRKIDSGDFGYYANLSDEQKKSLSMVVANRWMSCTSNKTQIVALNALVNPFVFKFASNHKELLYKLMLIASSGTEKHYTWIPKGKSAKRPNTCKILSEYYGFSTERAEAYINDFSVAEVVECAEALGADDSTIKKIKHEFKE